MKMSGPIIFITFLHLTEYIKSIPLFFHKPTEATDMNLFIWLPAMFFLGLTLMGLCYGFMKACEWI